MFSEHMSTLLNIAMGDDPLSDIYGMAEYYVRRLHLSSEADVELHYSGDELVDGYINEDGKVFSLTPSEMRIADDARKAYELAENKRRMSYGKGRNNG